MEKPEPNRNIVRNHDFTRGLASWRRNGCFNAFMFPSDEGCPKNQSSNLSGPFVVLTNRTETWQGLEQEITDRVSPRITYTVRAMVAVSGTEAIDAEVQATVKLENLWSASTFLCVGKASASTGRWVMVEGTFRLSAVPHRVKFYLEGPSPGTDLLIKSVVISPTGFSQSDSCGSGDKSIVVDKDTTTSSSGVNVVVNINLCDCTNKFNSITIAINQGNCESGKNDEVKKK